MAAEDEHEHCDCADHLERHHRVEAASGGQFKEGSIWAALFGTGTKAPTTSQIREEDQRCDEACIPAVVGPSRCGRGGYRAGDGGHYKVPIGSLAGQDGYGPGQGGYGPGGYGPGGYGSGGYGSGGNGPGGNGPGGNGPGGYGPGGYGAGRGGYGPDGHGAGRDGYGSGQAGGRRRAHGPGGYGPGKSGYGPGQGGYKRGHGKYGRGQYGAEAEGADGGVGGEAKRRTASDFLIPIIGGGLLFLTLVALLNRQFDVVSVVKSTADEVKKQIMNSLCETNEKGSGSFSGIGGGGVGGAGGGGGPGRSGSRDPCFHAKADKNNPCGNLKIRIHPERRKYQDPPHPDGIRALFPTIPGLHDCEDKEETPEEGVFTDPN